jgi:hypothetical protein
MLRANSTSTAARKARTLEPTSSRHHYAEFRQAKLDFRFSSRNWLPLRGIGRRFMTPIVTADLGDQSRNGPGGQQDPRAARGARIPAAIRRGLFRCPRHRPGRLAQWAQVCDQRHPCQEILCRFRILYRHTGFIPPVPLADAMERTVSYEFLGTVPQDDVSHTE